MASGPTFLVAVFTVSENVTQLGVCAWGLGAGVGLDLFAGCEREWGVCLVWGVPFAFLGGCLRDWGVCSDVGALNLAPR